MRILFYCNKCLKSYCHHANIDLLCFRAKVGELLPHVSSPKIHLQYAKAKEADGKCVRFILYTLTHTKE